MINLSLSKQKIGLVLGPLFFTLILLFYRPPGLSEAGLAVMASTVWVAIWWITEAIPLAATSLLPIVLFPLTGGLPIKQAVTGYSHPYIFLFIGGFVLAIAMEKWNLHKRIALAIIDKVGFSKPRIIMGFMGATAFLSMWISNTATTVMMLPIGLAILSQEKQGKPDGFGKALMLGIAYSASIGGIATLIGTPPNLILAGVIEETYGVEISFMQWFGFAAPFSITFLIICWLYLTRVAFKFETPQLEGGAQSLLKLKADLGKISQQEKRVLAIFIITALAWVSRAYLLQPVFSNINDTIIALIAALALFIIPSGLKGEALIDWQDMDKIPWGVLLLFGGGISLAVGFESSGLAVWLGSQLNSLTGVDLIVLLCILIVSVNFLTEITSNIATTSVILPILVPLALTINVHPFGLMVGTAMAASCAFMLPVATAPNALVFGTGLFKINDMIKAGIWLNLLSAMLLLALVYFILPLLWDIDLGLFPDALRTK